MSGISWGKKLTWSKGKQSLIKQGKQAATGDNHITEEILVVKPPRHLPEDVQRAISAFLTDKEIIKMIGASRFFYDMAMVRLFRKTDTYWTEYSLSALIQRLENPSVAALVEELTYCVSKQQPLQSDARKMRQILPLMHKVHTVSFTRMEYCPRLLILASLHTWSSHLQNLIIDGNFTVKCLRKLRPVPKTSLPNLKVIWRFWENEPKKIMTALAKFIRQFGGRLRSLSLKILYQPALTAIDICTLMSQLGTFPILESFEIAGNYTISDVSLAQQFLLRNHRTLRTCHFDKNAHLQPGFRTGFQWVNVLNRETCSPSPSISDLAVQLSDSEDTEYFLRLLQEVGPQLKCLAATGYYFEMSQVKRLCQHLGTSELPSQLESLTLFVHRFSPLVLDTFARQLPDLKQLRIFCFSVSGDDDDLYQTRKQSQKAFVKDLYKYTFLEWELLRLIVFAPTTHPLDNFSNLSHHFSYRTALECSIPSLKAAGRTSCRR